MSKIIIAKSIYVNVPNEKEVALYKAGFVGIDHTKTKNQNDTLIDRVTILSESDTFDTSEWVLSALEYHQDDPTACICGKTNLTNRYIMENIHNNVQISVGSSCLAKHFNLMVDKETLSAMEFAKGTGGKHSWLGGKYDALILYTLGFKKTMLYFTKRDNKMLVDQETNRLLKAALKLSLNEFDSMLWHKRLERGKRLLESLRRSHKKREREKHLSLSRARASIHKRPRIISSIPQQLQSTPEPLYKRTDIQDVSVLKVLNLESSNLSKDDVRTINTMKNYYNAQIKYRNEELSHNYKLLHSGRKLDLITYKFNLYALAEIQNRFCIFQNSNDDLLIYGYVTKRESACEAIELYLEAQSVFS